MRRKLAAGNWKMNGSPEALSMIEHLAAAHGSGRCDIALCPPATLLTSAVAAASDGPVGIGAQDCHAEAKGAFTGDCSASLIAQTGATYVILGHSERRDAHGETDALVAAKITAAQAQGLTAILCVGESLDDREAGNALDVISDQLAGSLPEDVSVAQLVVAYEPIWAIGTGRIPTHDQIAEVHAVLRKQLLSRFGETAQTIRLLYGGSVKADNAAGIFAIADVDGALVGGASLSAEDFSPIISALEAAP